MEAFKCCASASCLINTEPLELLRLYPSESNASESVIKQGLTHVDMHRSSKLIVYQKRMVKFLHIQKKGAKMDNSATLEDGADFFLNNHIEGIRAIFESGTKIVP